MLKILICAGQSDIACLMYNKLYRLLTDIKLRCELSYSSDAPMLMKNIDDSGIVYDIYMLDASDAGCVNLANNVRKKTLIPSIIFFRNTDDCNENLIKFRPSSIIQELNDTDKILCNAIRWCFNEQMRNRTYFNVKNKDVQIRIPYDNILYFESQQRIVTLYTTKQVIKFYAKLIDVQLDLPNDKFIRCHQSYIVNMSKIRQLDKVNRSFIMQSGTTIDISKSHYKAVVDEYERFTLNQ